MNPIITTIAPKSLVNNVLFRNEVNRMCRDQIGGFFVEILPIDKGTINLEAAFNALNMILRDQDFSNRGYEFQIIYSEDEFQGVKNKCDSLISVEIFPPNSDVKPSLTCKMWFNESTITLNI